MSGLTGVKKTEGKPYRSHMFLRVLLLLVALWLMISVYFYNQHILTVKTHPLNEEIKIGDVIVRLRELSLVNYERKSPANFETPWYFKFAVKLPISLQQPLATTIFFYSSPYEFSDKTGSLTTKGYIIVPKANLTAEDVRNYIDIQLSDASGFGYGNGWGMMNTESKNLFFILRKGDRVPLNISPVKISVTDKRTNSTKSIVVTPTWNTTTYNFFSSKPEHSAFKPGRTLSVFLNKQNSNSISEAEKFLVNKDTFKWNNLSHYFTTRPYSQIATYEGLYKGYPDVCSVAMFYFGKESDLLVAEQKFYLVEQNGSWKIIDVEPVIKYKEPRARTI